jgi:hypothetical protein
VSQFTGESGMKNPPRDKGPVPKVSSSRRFEHAAQAQGLVLSNDMLFPVYKTTLVLLLLFYEVSISLCVVTCEPCEL